VIFTVVLCTFVCIVLKFLCLKSLHYSDETSPRVSFTQSW